MTTRAEAPAFRERLHQALRAMIRLVSDVRRAATWLTCGIVPP
jgi:hypothetical protein